VFPAAMDFLCERHLRGWLAAIYPPSVFTVASAFEIISQIRRLHLALRGGALPYVEAVFYARTIPRTKKLQRQAGQVPSEQSEFPLRIL